MQIRKLFLTWLALCVFFSLLELSSITIFAKTKGEALTNCTKLDKSFDSYGLQATKFGIAREGCGNDRGKNFCTMTVWCSNSENKGQAKSVVCMSAKGTCPAP